MRNSSLLETEENFGQDVFLGYRFTFFSYIKFQVARIFGSAENPLLLLARDQEFLNHRVYSSPQYGNDAPKIHRGSSKNRNHG